MNDQSQADAYRRLIQIGIALSAEDNLDSLLQHILLEAKSLSNADAGTIYLHDGHDRLKFTIVLNDSLGITQENTADESVSLPEISLKNEDGSPNLSNMAASAVNRGETIVVDDTGDSADYDVSGARTFDDILGYRSVSVLSIPLRSVSNPCLGVLQLINAKDAGGEVIAFSEDLIPLIEALSSQASVAIENRALQDEQEDLKRQLEREVDTRTEELKQALTKLSEAHIILKELNTIDAVTGIRNRQYFDDVLDAEWRRARRQHYDISLMLLDIDHFKKVNDSYGHLVGDECLAAVAKIADEMFNRPSDVVARYGGEEFAIVLPYVSAENAVSVGEQLRLQIEDHVFEIDGHVIRLTVSIGIATLLPDNDTAPRDLIGRADVVLYEAKSSGRNRVCVHGQGKAPA